MARRVGISWDGPRMAFAAGMTLAEISKKFGIAEGSVNSACSRQGWNRLLLEAKNSTKQRTENLTGNSETGNLQVIPPDAARVLAEDLAEKGNAHRVQLAHLIEQKMEDLKADGLPEVKFMSDVKILDDIARRNFGLDQEASQQKCIINLALLLGDV